MNTNMKRYYWIHNLAGGDARRFCTNSEGLPSDRSIRHARRIDRTTFGGWQCSDPHVSEKIDQILDSTGEGY